MDYLIRNVIVLGGGTAGWMAATYLHKAFEGNVNVTLIEAPMIPRIGVGEATIPNLQTVFFDFLGIPESEWMIECRASYKCAVKFVNWKQPPGKGVVDHFYHPFDQIPICGSVPLSQYWFLRDRANESEPLDYACFRETPVLDALRSPYTMDGIQRVTHAWHFDAHFVAEFLKKWAIKQGVRYIVDTLDHAFLDERGFITGLHMESGATYAADLFVDCSGFRGLLINKTMNEPFIDMGDHLFCDRAVATAILKDTEERHDIDPYTSAIALKNGWVWKIPQFGRVGTGYVYSSKFVSDDDAVDEFLNLWNLDPAKVTLNRIRFRTGRNRRSWVKNCVSIGLASCFVEPLESTAIYFTYAAIYQLVKYFPDKSFNPVLSDRFNREIELMFDDTMSFIQAHYHASPRSDTPFWKANQHELCISDDLKCKLETYKAGLPVNQVSDIERFYTSFETNFHTYWNNTSYYVILAGLGYLPDNPMPKLLYQPSSWEKATAMFADVKQEARQLLDELPPLFDYLQKLYRGRDVQTLIP
jgi:tryptophan 6-halogenase